MRWKQAELDAAVLAMIHAFGTRQAAESRLGLYGATARASMRRLLDKGLVTLVEPYRGSRAAKFAVTPEGMTKINSSSTTGSPKC
jgi:hypothetical protein